MLSDKYWSDEVYATFLPSLDKVIEKHKGSTLEFGAGNFSTPFLCERLKGEELYTLESDKEWCNLVRDKNFHTDPKHSLHHIEVWEDSFVYQDSEFFERDDWSVIFIDHSPGEHRIIEVQNFINKCDVMVIHDYDADSKGGAYGWASVDSLFKWKVEVPSRKGVPHPNPSTAIVSNRVDVTQWNCFN